MHQIHHHCVFFCFHDIFCRLFHQLYNHMLHMTFLQFLYHRLAWLLFLMVHLFEDLQFLLSLCLYILHHIRWLLMVFLYQHLIHLHFQLLFYIILKLCSIILLFFLLRELGMSHHLYKVYNLLGWNLLHWFH